ncbi:uncharacterized protein LOC141629301 [Silene latifolia]|uniref:uncharacterized protein LOC141629301 n=1 Tax=Silene latifolia TaxID=37657 RepID=UPI003D7732EF
MGEVEDHGTGSVEYKFLQEQVESLTNQLSTLALRLDQKDSNSFASPIVGSLDVINFFTVADIAELKKVTYAFVHLESRALAWHQTYTKNRTSIIPLGWDEYRLAIKARFGDPFEDPMTEMLALKQIDNVKTYHDSFDLILSKLNLPPAYALSCFISGLKENIASMVRLLKPKSVQEDYGLAKLLESSLQLNNQTTKLQSTPPPS